MSPLSCALDLRYYTLEARLSLPAKQASTKNSFFDRLVIQKIVKMPTCMSDNPIVILLGL